MPARPRYTYALSPLVDRPSSAEDFAVFQIRNDGRERRVDPAHHAYRAWVAGGNAPSVRAEQKERRPAAPLTAEEAERSAIARHAPEYMAALMRWEAFGGGTKGDALAEWKAAVLATRDRLIGG